MDLKEMFDNLHTEKLNFKGLYQFIIDKDVKMEFVGFKVSALGMAAFDKIYINKRMICSFEADFIFAVICHEIGHFLSFKKHGNQYHMDRLSSTNWDEFIGHVIHEEILADKISTLLYYKLNKVSYTGILQNLHLKHNQDKYSTIIKNSLFGLYPNDINEYQKVVESMIIR